MTKEQIFAGMKSLILDLHKHNNEFKFNPELSKDWVERSKKLQEDVNALNSCDLLWLTDVYESWHKKEIEPLAQQYLKNPPKI